MSRSLRPRLTILRIKKSKRLHQGIAASLSIFIIAIIIFAPTAAAITVETPGLTEGLEIASGGSFQFRVRVSINSYEFVSINNLQIFLDGIKCTFNPSTGVAIGPISSVCSAISSVAPENFVAGQLFTSAYGYGYGYLLAYGYGFLPSLKYGYGYSYGSPSTYGYGFTGPRTFSYLVTLSPSSMALGSHNLRAVIETGLSPISEFTSATTTFSIVSGTSTSASVTPADIAAAIASGVPVTVDHRATTNVLVAITGASLEDATVPAIITTQKFASGTVPTTAVTITASTGKTAAKYLDVKATNFLAGIATITVTYTDAEIVGLNENTLTLYYYSATSATWTELTGISRTTVLKTISGDISVTNLKGTVIALAASTPVTPGVPTPAVLTHITAAIQTTPLTVAPGSSTSVALTLKSSSLINAGNVTFTLPKYFKVSNIVFTNFTGTSSLTGTTLRIDKTSAQDTRSLAVSFTLTAPLNSSIQVGEKYNVTASAALTLSTVTFQNSNTVTLTIEKPSVASIFSALDSYFGKTTSVYTENRVPVAKDILNLLDFYFQGKV